MWGGGSLWEARLTRRKGIVRRRLVIVFAAIFISVLVAACGERVEEEPPLEEQVQEDAPQQEERTEEAKEELQERQQASYYGEEFAGNPTASGEPYDPYGLTAAHPYLPLGTELSVSHEGRSVIVTVNDRNSSGLDLSLGAAQAIGLTEVGTAVVDAEVVEDQPSPA